MWYNPYSILFYFCEGDNHSIMIYYPSSAGGGMKELFRKVSFKLTYHSPKCGQVYCIAVNILEHIVSLKRENLFDHVFCLSFTQK